MLAQAIARARAPAAAVAARARMSSYVDTFRPHMVAVLERHDALTARLNDPDHFPPPSEFARINKELSDLQASVETIRAVVRAAVVLEEADEVLRQADAGDEEAAELEAIAREERSAVVAQIEAMEGEVMAYLVPRDEMDSRGVIMEFRAGAGGEEAGLFAAEVMAMYERFVQLQGWAAETLTLALSENGGLREGSMAVRGAGAFGWLKWESGVHRVQRVPATESSGRIHTSTMTVAVLPEAEEVDVEFGPADLQVETFRASGAGGQHVNTTDSAVRVTHLPTGTVVAIQDERSQHQNKEKAVRLLRSRIFEERRQRAMEERSAHRIAQIGTGDRSERIRTYNYPQGRVTDHRIGFTVPNLNAVLEGRALEDIIDALASEENMRKLEQMKEEVGART